jgi:hypothetical protein
LLVLAWVALAGRAHAADAPARLSMHDLARRLNHPGSIIPLDALRHQQLGGRFIRTPDDRILRLPGGTVEPPVAQTGSQFAYELSSRLGIKPFTFIPGIRIAKKGELPFPVVDIASSWAKLKWGSPMYGYGIAKQAQRVVDQYASQSGWRPSTMVLFGYGPIGRAQAHAAQRLEKRRLIRMVLRSRRGGRRAQESFVG